MENLHSTDFPLTALTDTSHLAHKSGWLLWKYETDSYLLHTTFPLDMAAWYLKFSLNENETFAVVWNLFEIWHCSVIFKACTWSVWHFNAWELKLKTSKRSQSKRIWRNSVSCGFQDVDILSSLMMILVSSTTYVSIVTDLFRGVDQKKVLGITKLKLWRKLKTSRVRMSDQPEIIMKIESYRQHFILIMPRERLFLSEWAASAEPKTQLTNIFNKHFSLNFC